MEEVLKEKTFSKCIIFLKVLSHLMLQNTPFY